ncbi:MAG: orotate phosphoribosyltransferase [Bacteroidales bacterium]|nr:orotate phosphoribosyltransferase [Bacteroidales bacterium]
MSMTEKNIADKLLQINAIKLQPANPFTWASGWKSPIYCDNRKTLSYPAVRKEICEAFVSKIKELYPSVELIAGVATGAIAHGMLVAEAMGLPFIYIRSSSKAHGLTNMIEGDYSAGQKVVVIEDLISTGGSSLKAVEALREANCDVLGMLAIFSYEFPVAQQNFEKASCAVSTLSNYSTLIEHALTKKYISQDDVSSLQEWRKQPETWGK